jgi:hypothetical protein
VKCDHPGAGKGAPRGEIGEGEERRGIIQPYASGSRPSKSCIHASVCGKSVEGGRSSNDATKGGVNCGSHI